MKIVVFGAHGLLGTELRKLDENLICPTKSEVDIRYPNEVRYFIKNHHPDIVINAAAVLDNRVLENSPEKAISTNIVGAANVANICIEDNIRYIYVSTDYIYKGDRGSYKESDEILPFNFYAWTKLGGECSAKGVKNHLIIRLSFGASGFSYPIAFSDKWSSKDYVDRLAPMVLEAAKSPLTGVLNLGTDRKTLFDYAKERNPNVKPVKLADTSFFTPYDTSFNLQKWLNYKSDKPSISSHTECRICKSKNLIKYLDLGLLPLANNLENSSYEAKKMEKFPLQIMICEQCSLSQLSVIVDPKKMFSNYVYRSSINKPYVEHCRIMAKTLRNDFSLTENSFMIDIAGNDGTLLKQFKEEIGLKVLNVDPASNLAAISESQGIPTIADFWSYSIAAEILEKYGQADLITATNVFAHVNDVHEFIIAAKRVLKDDGILVIECPYIDEFIYKLEYNQTYFEHLSYMSVTPVDYLCKIVGMKLIAVSRPRIHGGTIRMIIGKDCCKYFTEDSVFESLDFEDWEGYTKPEFYKEWAYKVKNSISEIKETLLSIKKEGKSIAAIAASAKGNTLLNVCGINTEIIDVIVDETSEKIGKFSPGTGIPIVNKRYFHDNSPDYLVILAENFKDQLIEKAKEAGFKGKFIIPVPTFEII
jgi:dTDP-4-dehydrorhamnose reductase/SAM-dependent methyltransferase